MSVFDWQYWVMNVVLWAVVFAVAYAVARWAR